jgi:hypothetical protein
MSVFDAFGEPKCAFPPDTEHFERSTPICAGSAHGYYFQLLRQSSSRIVLLPTMPEQLALFQILVRLEVILPLGVPLNFECARHLMYSGKNELSSPLESACTRSTHAFRLPAERATAPRTPRPAACLSTPSQHFIQAPLPFRHAPSSCCVGMQYFRCSS